MYLIMRLQQMIHIGHLPIKTRIMVLTIRKISEHWISLMIKQESWMIILFFRCRNQQKSIIMIELYSNYRLFFRILVELLALVLRCCFSWIIIRLLLWRCRLLKKYLIVRKRLLCIGLKILTKQTKPKNHFNKIP